MRVDTAFLAAILLICPMSAFAGESIAGAKYSLKQDSPDTGSLTKRDVVTGGQIPFNKRYAELTAEQKLIVKSEYEQMGETDEPPFPAYGLAPIYKALSRGQDRLSVDGPLIMFVTVDSQGRAKSVSVLQSPDPKMTQYAAGVLMLETYKPALCDGTPCTMQFPFRITFSTRMR